MKIGGKPINPVELNNTLSLKADNRRLDLFDDIKVDKAELEGYSNIMIKQNKQFIALIGILIEYLQLTIPKASIAENASLSKSSSILKRMFSLFQSVNNVQDIQHDSPNKIYHLNKPRSFSNK